MSKIPRNISLDYVLLPETHSPMYLMHKFWARKPANIIRHYILKYSAPGDIILDPFMGSGVTVLEAVFNDRKAVGIDINPISSFICANTGKFADISLYQEGFQWIENQVFRKPSLYSQLYYQSCPYCQENAEITHLIWHNSTQSSKQVLSPDTNSIYQLLEIRLFCPNCGSVKILPEDADFERINLNICSQNERFQQDLSVNDLRFLKFHLQYSNKTPFLQLRHSLRNNNAMSELFSPRALIFLTWLREKIMNLPSKFNSIRDLMLFTFSSSISQASRMVWVIDKRRGRELTQKQVGSWTHHFFWNPHKFFEVNAWNCFKFRYQKVLRGKKESNSRNSMCQIPFQPAPNLDIFFNSKDFPVYLLTQSITKCSLPENSVDFIFTDPPYGDSIQYGELSALWANWLGYDMNSYLSSISCDEIVINSNQNKNLQRYQSLLREAFSVLYRVLKPDKYMVLTFHNTSTKIRNALVLSILKSGFELKQILFQLPARASLKSMLHHEGSPIGDYFLRFQKLSSNSQPYYSIYKKKIATTSYQKQKTKIKELIIEILQKRGEPTYFIWITNLIDEFLYREFLFPLPNFEECVHDLMVDPDFKINSQRQWWLTSQLHLSKVEIPLQDRIRVYLRHLIDSKIIAPSSKSAKQFFFNKIYESFRGVLTPDKYTINQLIQEIVY